MRYLLAIALLAIGVVPVILEGNGTFLILAAIIALTLILDKRDWTKGPDERRNHRRNIRRGRNPVEFGD